MNYTMPVGDLTNVGAYTRTKSPYGAFDMDGSVWGMERSLVRRLVSGFAWQFVGRLRYQQPTLLEPEQRSCDVRELPIGFRVATVPSPADFNGDGAVETHLRAWQTGYGLNGSATLMQGDADGDLDVDGVDFLAWQQHLSSSTPAVSTNAPVPEPATSLLFIVAAAGIRRLSCRKCQILVGE